MNMKMIFIGGGGDAGYWTWENGKLVHHGGWEAGRLADVIRATTILGEASRLKTPGLAELASKSVGEFLQKELGAHLGDQLKGGGVVIVNTSAH